MREKILEEIKLLADKYRVLNNILLALLSGVIGLLFGMTQNKVIMNNFVFITIIIGFISIGMFSYKIFKIDKERRKLIDKLKEKRWKK